MSESNPYGVATLAFDANSAVQLCKQLGYQSGSAEEWKSTEEIPGLKDMVISQLVIDSIALNTFDDNKG